MSRVGFGQTVFRHKGDLPEKTCSMFFFCVWLPEQQALPAVRALKSCNRRYQKLCNARHQKDRSVSQRERSIKRLPKGANRNSEPKNIFLTLTCQVRAVRFYVSLLLLFILLLPSSPSDLCRPLLPRRMLNSHAVV